MQNFYSNDPDIINETIEEDEYSGDIKDEELQDRLEYDESEMYSSYGEIY